MTSATRPTGSLDSAFLHHSPLTLEEDRTLSPYTGWTRDHWVGLAEQLLAAARAHGSHNHARIHFPGAEGGYGHNVDGLEGFTRTFLAAGFLAAGSEGRKLGPLEWYAKGFSYGPDPTLDPSVRWVRPSEHDQAKVEACSLALILHLTKPYLWDNLDSRTQEMTIGYLAEWIHASYPKNNWVWFRLITEQFLKSVGAPWSVEDQEEDLAFNESCYVDRGWYRDGTGRTFDHYVGWVFHVYPLLWCAMAPTDPESIRLRPIFQERLDAYLNDLIHLIGADGGMLAQGRSLIYRFASAAPLWMAALTDSPTLSPGQVRRAASGLVKNFATHGAPDDEGVLSMGWYGPWRKLAQSYSGPGSPYWACKGLLGLALPETHPVWTTPEEPLPADTTDTVVAMPVPGWLVSSADGIQRVINHGTDHSTSGSAQADSPLYAHLSYSTASFPPLDPGSWVNPLAQSVCLTDAQGRASHRTGFQFMGAEAEPSDPDQQVVGIAASQADAHWVDPNPTQFLHGSGYIGDSAPAGRITILSVVRGPWEVRAVHLDSVSPKATGLRIGGWAVAGQEIMSSTSSEDTEGFAAAATEALASSVRTLSVPATGGVLFFEDASPLGTSAVPYLDFPVLTGHWVSALIALNGQVSPRSLGEKVRIAADIRSAESTISAHVVWPDGVDTRSTLLLSTLAGRSPITQTVPSGTTLEGEKQ